ncbi:MAG: hypothetical protein WD939_07205, partial [Dehalococcoidia bacterium]
MGDRSAWFAVLTLTATLALSVACFGGGDDEPIAYLHRADSILIQKKTTTTSPDAVLPDLTLYGDGTIIYLERPGDQTSPLLEALLADDAVLGLLELLIDEGFLDFTYEQPEPDRATDQPTTYLYVRTMTAANAVSANAVDSVLPDDAGDEFDDFRKLQRLVEELDAIDPVALGGSPPRGYEPEDMLLFVEPRDPPNVAGSPLQWPNTAITLADIAPGSERVEVVLEGEQALALDGWAP